MHGARSTNGCGNEANNLLIYARSDETMREADAAKESHSRGRVS